jgi:hypothetical protein
MASRVARLLLGLPVEYEIGVPATECYRLLEEYANARDEIQKKKFFRVIRCPFRRVSDEDFTFSIGPNELTTRHGLEGIVRQQNGRSSVSVKLMSLPWEELLLVALFWSLFALLLGGVGEIATLFFATAALLLVVDFMEVRVTLGVFEGIIARVESMPHTEPER